MNRPRWPVVLEYGEDDRFLHPPGEWWLSGEDLGPTQADEYLEIRTRKGPAYLPSKHSERKHVRRFGSAGVDESKGVRIDELRSDPIEELLRVHLGPASGESEREGGSQATQTSHSVVVDQDVTLEESERTMPVYGRRRRTILTFPWTISCSCMYFNAREIPVIYGR